MPESATGVHERKCNKPLLIITTLQTQCDTSIYFKFSNLSESQPSTKMDYFVLSASFYPVDWLIGQSTWPTYAYERIFIKAFMSDDGLKLSYVRAINCATMSDVNSLFLVFSIFCGAQDVSYHLYRKVASLFSPCQDEQVPHPKKKEKKRGSWIYVFIFIYTWIFRLWFIVTRTTRPRQKIIPAINTLGWLFCTAVKVIIYFN